MIKTNKPSNVKSKKTVVKPSRSQLKKTEPNSASGISTGGADSEEIYTNKDMGVIQINPDKVYRILSCFIEKMKINTTDKTIWIAPFGLCASILMTLITAEFKQSSLGVSGATWMAVFIIGLIISGVWLVCTGVKSLTAWRKTSNKSDSELIEDIITDMKNKKTNK